MKEAEEEVAEEKIEKEIYAGTRWAATCFTTAIKVEVYSDQWTLRFASKNLRRMLPLNSKDGEAYFIRKLSKVNLFHYHMCSTYLMFCK